MTCNKALNPSQRAKYALVEKKVNQVVNRCVRNGAIAPKFNVQDFRFKLLKGDRTHPCRKYDPFSALSGYLGSGSMNLNRRQTYGVYNDRRAVKAFEPPVYPLLEQMKNDLKKALALLGLDTPKHQLLFKIQVAKPLALAELVAYGPKVRKNHLSRFHTLFEAPYALRNKEDNLALILPLLRKVEAQDHTVESVRQLINHKLEQLRKHLNDHTTYNFDGEALSNLLFVVL